MVDLGTSALARKWLVATTRNIRRREFRTLVIMTWLFIQFMVDLIAMTFLACAPDIWYGIALLVLGIGIAAVRVISGVHYISDVLAAAGIAVLAGVIGFWVIPV